MRRSDLKRLMREAEQAAPRRGNRGWIFGNLLVTTCIQGAGAPLIDQCFAKPLGGEQEPTP